MGMADFKLAGIVSAVGFGLGYLLSGRTSQVRGAESNDIQWIDSLEFHDDSENKHKYYAHVRRRLDDYVVYGRLPGYGRASTVAIKQQIPSDAARKIYEKVNDGYRSFGIEGSEIGETILKKFEEKFPSQSPPKSEPKQPSEPKQEEPKKPVNARQRIFMERRGLKKNAETRKIPTTKVVIIDGEEYRIEIDILYGYGWDGSQLSYQQYKKIMSYDLNIPIQSKNGNSLGENERKEIEDWLKRKFNPKRIWVDGDSRRYGKTTENYNTIWFILNDKVLEFFGIKIPSKKDCSKGHTWSNAYIRNDYGLDDDGTASVEYGQRCELCDVERRGSIGGDVLWDKNAETFDEGRRFEANGFERRWKDGSLRLIDEEADDDTVIQFFVRKNNADSYDVLLNDTLINDERLNPMKDSSLGDSYWIIGKIRRDRRGWKIIVPVLSENTITWQNDPYHSEGHRMLESHRENLYGAVDSIMWWFREQDGGLDFYNWVKSSSEAETFESERKVGKNKWLQAIYDAIYDENDPSYKIMYQEQGQYGYPISTSSSLIEISMTQKALADGKKPPTERQVKNGMLKSINEASGKKMNPKGAKNYGVTTKASYEYNGKRFFVRYTVKKPLRGSKEPYELAINGEEYFENPMMNTPFSNKDDYLQEYGAETFEADMSVGNEMLRQLGGRRFMMMVGAKQPIWNGDENELGMKIGRNAIGANYFVIRLNPRDLYDLRFESRRMNRKTYEMSVKVKAEHNDVYADQLQEIFENTTGLYTRMAESFEAEGVLCSDCPMAGRHVVIRKDHTDEEGNLICPFCHSNKNFKNIPETTYLLHGGRREDLRAEYQPDQEIADYSVSEIAKSSAIEGYQPNKYSFGPIGYSAESISSLKLKKDSCCCGATKKTPCVCMILGSDCSAKKPMCACYRLKGIQQKDEKGAETFNADGESTDSIPKPNPADKEEAFAWVKREHPHIKTDADREMEGVDYAAMTYHPEELEAGAINALKAGDFEAAERFVKALNRQNFIKAFQAEGDMEEFPLLYSTHNVNTAYCISHGTHYNYGLCEKMGRYGNYRGSEGYAGVGKPTCTHCLRKWKSMTENERKKFRDEFANY